jgi:hypothetical protein
LAAAFTLLCEAVKHGVAPGQNVGAMLASMHISFASALRI